MPHISKNQIKLIRSLQQKKYRDESRLFVAEGEKCIEELRKTFSLVLLVNKDNATTREIEQMSSLRSPQGEIGVLRQREMSDTDISAEIKKGSLILALDGIQDPGNLGTIIRTADWFGINHIVCSRDTADCYNPKVVQATMGSLARVKLTYTNLPDFLNKLENDIPIYGTLLNGNNIYESQLQQPAILVMGNEGNGISAEVRQLITHPLLIPSFRQGDHAESLNVAIATAVTLSEFMRR